MMNTLSPKGHPQPNMLRVWFANDGEEDWIELGTVPCPGCSECDPTLWEQYERARDAGTLPF